MHARNAFYAVMQKEYLATPFDFSVDGIFNKVFVEARKNRMNRLSIQRVVAIEKRPSSASWRD